MAALPVKEAQCRQMFSSYGVEGKDVQVAESLNVPFILLRGLGLSLLLPSPKPDQILTHIVSEGDIGTSCQQHADHINVLVFCGPDDRRPPTTILWVGRSEGQATGPAHQSVHGQEHKLRGPSMNPSFTHKLRKHGQVPCHVWASSSIK